MRAIFIRHGESTTNTGLAGADVASTALTQRGETALTQRGEGQAGARPRRPGPGSTSRVRAGGRAPLTERYPSDRRLAHDDLGDARSDDRVHPTKHRLDSVAGKADLDHMRVGNGQAVSIDDDRPREKLNTVCQRRILTDKDIITCEAPMNRGSVKGPVSGRPVGSYRY